MDGQWRIYEVLGKPVRIVDQDGETIAHVQGVAGNDLCHQRAVLLRAAPDLLAALEGIAHGLTNGQKERGETFQTIAAAAIAKAKGETL